MRSPLLLLPLALAVCVSALPAHGTQAPPPGSTAATAAEPDVALLGGYHWRLTQASDHGGQRIAALFVRPDKPLQLDFGGNRVNVRNSCNGMGGSYHIENGHLVVGPMMHTMMACPDLALNQLDSLVGATLSGRPAIAVSHEGAHPQLQLRTAAGDTLDFTGVPTAETRYGGPGVTEFLEVAAQTVPCHHPLMRNRQCLSVRDVHYDANGLKTGTPGHWRPLQQDIEGYTHQPGVRNVLRVKRYTMKHPPADASASAYVLDMVVESQTVAH
ncbi:META and DUF4377 domain-containing protein [Rhodanobacter sp. PCA2]|uniref:META and DUF4377 domain-containing protein n=1 Tax=Rhodanobacter sp. PCA2 TaxID=2006117 RepID=UPI0015E699C7|nr:META and DUF4377 domain-containing protein [Rhodanobacter sp. PCA2]MBA2077270.1 hypothetical protein [Rhodanobacter sp. PCA2]